MQEGCTYMAAHTPLATWEMLWPQTQPGHQASSALNDRVERAWPWMHVLSIHVVLHIVLQEKTWT